MEIADNVFRWFDAVWAWISTWPPTFVGVVIGSMFTLLGVVITNRTNLRNLKTQLEHNRKEAAKQLALSMRRDVYLAVAEAISAALEAIIRFCDLSIDQASLMADYRAKSAQIAKVHIIATEETALAFVAFMRNLSATFMKLTISRAELQVTRTQMLSLLAKMERHNASKDRCLESMREHTVEGTMDQRRMDVLERTSTYEAEAALKAATDHDALAAELRPKQLDLIELCQREQARLSAQLLPVIAAVRRELELPIDVERYAKVFAGGPVVTRQDLEDLWRVHA